MTRGLAITGALIVATGAACGGGAAGGAFGLSARDSDPAGLERALAQRQLPAQPSPINASGAPRLFAVTGGAARSIVAVDLAAGAPRWTTPANVESRISVGGDFIVELEDHAVVARDQARGQRRWQVAVPGGFVGAAADRTRAYVVTQDGAASSLAAYDGATGRALWQTSASGSLGAPAAHGGVVYVPLLSQWLVILDGATGAPLGRIRGVDEEISMLRTTSTAAYFGSKQGAFLLDARSATGTRAGASYRQLAVPAELDHIAYGLDRYSPAQVTYSAADRARLLWSALPTPSGAMRLAGDGYAIHYFRFVFGFDAAGGLRWAYSHPRVELVASDDTGAVIAGVSAAGELVALDRATGAVRVQRNLGIQAPVIGATIDADGWAPAAEAASAPAPAATLAAIVRDRDARFDKVKALAIRLLAQQPGTEATSALLALIGDEHVAALLREAAAEAIAARRDPASLPALTAALAVQRDYLAGTEAAALGPIARAITKLAEPRDPAVDPAQATAAVAALVRHLDAPSTPLPDLLQVIAALAALGGGDAQRALAAHVALYHADAELGADPSWQQAIIRALDAHDDNAQRALAALAGDPRSPRPLAELAEAHIATDRPAK